MNPAQKKDGDLSFLVGDEIQVTDSTHPSWWKGIRLADKSQGIFPSQYVVKQKAGVILYSFFLLNVVLKL